MSGCQKATVLVLLCAVVVVFWALMQVVETTMNQPQGTPSPLVLHTPTATATSTGLPSDTTGPEQSPTAVPSPAYTSTYLPTDTPTATPVPPSPTPPPTATQTPRPSPTSVAQPTVPAEVAVYLKDLTGLVAVVDEMGLLESSARGDQGTAEQLRSLYRRLHEMRVPKGAEEMHLAFVTYVSVLEQKCLCHVFADAHSGSAQGQHYRQCEGRAGSVALELLNNRFLPSRDAFLRRYSLTAAEA